MIKNFFHALNNAGILYILISGQAAVIYGASTFSEDINIWIDPKQEKKKNCSRPAVNHLN